MPIACMIHLSIQHKMIWLVDSPSWASLASVYQARSQTFALGVQRMEPDPLLERLDTVLGEDSEKLGFVPTELPPNVEDILDALKGQAGVESISLGRQVCTQEKSGRASHER